MTSLLQKMGAAERLSDAIARRGTQIIVRRFTSTPGPVPSLNPASFEGLTVGTAITAGDMSVTLAATKNRGRLIAGDVLWIGGIAHTISQTTVARMGPPGFNGVGLTVPAPAGFAVGLPVELVWTADLVCFAMIDSFPIRLVDGDRIQSRDLSLQFSAYLLPDFRPTWSVFVAGREMSVVSAQPVFERGMIVRWSVQAR